jgi:hypothetical protein
MRNEMEGKKKKKKSMPNSIEWNLKRNIQIPIEQNHNKMRERLNEI